MSWMRRLRPNILVVVIGLLVLGVLGLLRDAPEITTGAVSGIIALAKDIIAAEDRGVEVTKNDTSN